ncbi:tetratricopeptide repeat protein [bacterium]|nr:tetratricopeptide repeat protein [bacterium]
MKKSLLTLLVGGLSIATVVYAAETTQPEDELLLALTTNFRPARPASADAATNVVAQPGPAQPAPVAPTPAPAVQVAPAPAPTPAPAPAPVTAPAPKPAPAPQPVVMDAEREEIEQAAREELIRRQEAQLAARQLLAEGHLLYDQRNYEAAVQKYEQALQTLPRARATEDDIADALDGLNRTYFRLAEVSLEAGDRAKAREHAQKALQHNPNSRAARSVMSRVEREERVAKARKEQPLPPTRPDRTEDFLKTQGQIKELFREGKILMNSGQYDEAENRFQQILLLDSYNSDAHIFLDELNQRRLSLAKVGTDSSRNERLWEVGKAWIPRIPGDVKLPDTKQSGPIGGAAGATAAITERLNRIVFPEINLRDAVITDVIPYLSEESRRLDTNENIGVNIVLNLGEGSEGGFTAPAAVAPAMGLGPEGAFAPEQPMMPAAPELANVRRVTVSLRRIPLIDALKLITAAANLKFRIEPTAIVVLPKDAPEGELITRSYPVQSGVLPTLVSQPGGGGGGFGGGDDFTALGSSGAQVSVGDVKKLFTDAGVPFPQGSSLIYNERTSRIIIRNTPEGIEIFEKVLADFNVVPNQVEIEAKFIDISQSDLDELGFEWKVGHKLFGDLDATGGNVPFGDVPDLAAGEGDITGGLRDSTVVQGNALDALLGLGGAVTPNNLGTLRGVLTNPQFEVILRALAQKKSTDLLSAPKITTISGQAAQLRVVQEFIYPTEYEPPQVGDNVVSPPIPGAFKTRELGVLLNVTPTIGADGYTVNLTVIPEVSEFLGFIDYSPGETINITTDVDGNTRETRSPNTILQPLFSSRNLTTQVLMWDGQTIVLGGLIREDINKIDDKVPFLGDIPFLGRLFRSKVDIRSKRNLLIFVTANIVDPAGNKINRGD